MPRKGLPKVRTGRVTCKVRKIKCDESRPECQRCKSTGRTCDGYKPPPSGSYSWSHLLRGRPRPALTPTPSADPIELRGLAFFRQVVAPVLGGPLDGSFWTHLVAQVTYSEPAARHAVLAISSLYEAFGARQLELEFAPPHDGNEFAIKHYNSAIRHIVTPHASSGSIDTVLLVCVLFICIEFLRGDAKAAISHVSHGISLLNSSKARSDIVSTFRHLAIFPYSITGDAATFPVLEDAHLPPTSGGSFEDLFQAQGSLDSLLSRSVRLVRTSEHHRLGLGPELQSLESAAWDQRRFDGDLDAWWSAFSISREGFQLPDPHEATLLTLEVRWLAAKILTSTCLSPDETIYDAHMDRFRRIVEIATQEQATRTTTSPTKSPKFTFVMGFCPVLYFVVVKCRHLKLRLAALTLMKTLPCPRETLWDAVTLHAIGTRMIEIEHGIEVTPDEIKTLQSMDESELALPEDGKRIRDSTLEAGLDVRKGDGGTRVVRRKIRFLVRSWNGSIEAMHDWVTMK
ncbi:putative transcriptional regulatory protein C15D4.02 [Tolypocladium ophioglossoides CBS 100239]|uniref:Putative transcriptional regulatory protein C15D4.02 n=1 Tax=Tolypocladium ophioglossoides (strain CBS 100239) TaxID=1163406 RepID=A0A0L0N7R0_TOLOC|nr:putative transcriptional regulatory protein C15D4.02 [Tolypocladium ophioglossoides CBS 100239]